MSESRPKASTKPTPPLPEKVGRDYYWEDGKMVLTEHYLKARGYCCESGCRHCPYGFKRKK